MAIFDDTASTPTANLETLVGEGKKYSSPDELAKAYVNADATIEARNRELAELREELNVRLAVEEQLKRIQPNTAQVVPPSPASAPTEPAREAAMSQKDLDARIQEVMSQTQAKERQARNLEQVTTRLVDTFGDEDKANAQVRAKAAELGVSVQFLLDVATASPKAFFTQLGLDTPASGSRPVPASRRESAVNIVNTPGVKADSYEYFEQIRKADPKRYFDPSIQNQIMKAAFEGRYVPPGS